MSEYFRLLFTIYIFNLNWKFVIINQGVERLKETPLAKLITLLCLVLLSLQWNILIHRIYFTKIARMVVDFLCTAMQLKNKPQAKDPIDAYCVIMYYLRFFLLMKEENERERNRHSEMPRVVDFLNNQFAAFS